MHYYKRNLGDYYKKAGRLTMLEHGAYTLLIDACYDRESFPTMDEAKAWCWVQSELEERAVESVLARFFILEGERYIQARIQEEIDDYLAKANKNKEIAIAREEARRAKRASIVDESSTNRAQVVHDESTNRHLTNNQEPITNNQNKDLDPKDLPDSSNQTTRRKGTRLTNGFVIPDEWKAWAAEEFKGLGSGVNRIAADFVDYWIAVPGAKGVKLDWFATWRNWVRRDLERRRPASPAGRAATPATAINQMAEEYQRKINSGEFQHDPSQPF